MTETSARDRQAVITEAAIAAARAQIGIELPSRGQFNDYATVDTIRHFAYGTGDPNPLFADPEYAATTRWGGMIAPAPFLFTCMGSFPWGMPGVHALWCGAEFECHAPIRAGARIVTTVCLSDVQEKRSEFTGRGVMQTWTFTHRDGEGALLAKTRLWMLRTERDTARERGKYREIQPPHYADAELAAIEEWYDREELRGGRPRYWEDVVEGEALAPVLKGPLTVTDLIGFKVGWGFRPFVMPNRIGWEYRRRHPGLTSKNEQGIWDVPERVHWDTDFARFVGAPAAFDYGPQRVAWLGHLVTNWIGDDGFLKLLRGEVRRLNVVGDTTYCRGKVARRWIENGEHLVACELWCENQRGEVTAPGYAIAVLPSRSE